MQVNSEKGRTMTKSWMWGNEGSGGVSGARINTEKGVIQWFNEPGCACAGSDFEQSTADFLENGTRFITPPDDILAEMQDILAPVKSS